MFLTKSIALTEMQFIGWSIIPAIKCEKHKALIEVILEDLHTIKLGFLHHIFQGNNWLSGLAEPDIMIFHKKKTPKNSPALAKRRDGLKFDKASWEKNYRKSSDI